MQLIDHGIAQGMIGKGPHGSVVTCINLAFIVRKKSTNGEMSLHSMDTHPPLGALKAWRGMLVVLHSDIPYATAPENTRDCQVRAVCRGEVV